MLLTIIRAAIVGAMLALVYLVLRWLLGPLVPAMILTSIGVILVLVFLAYVIRAFGITF